MPETLQTDVLIVGAGGAGLCAAVEAKAAGAQVIVVEREATPGGATAISGGGSCLAGTPLQKAMGIEDSPALALEDWLRFGGKEADEVWARYYLENTKPELYDWLQALGVRWEDVHQQEGNTVPRWHKPEGAGEGIWKALHAKCQSLGLDALLCATSVEEIIARDGRVVGLHVRDLEQGKSYDILARTVVMASGGFASNVEMIYRYRPDLRRFRVVEGGHIGATGHGHGIVSAVGGFLTHMEHLWMYVHATPDYRDPRGKRGLVFRGLPDYVWVNAQGKRFHDESRPGGASGTPAVLAQDPPYAWALIDSTMQLQIQVSDPYYRARGTSRAERIQELFQCSPFIKTGDSLEALAQAMQVPVDALTETVHRYNGFLEAGLGKDPDFSRPLKGRKPIAVAPFHAIQMVPLSRKSFGGVKTDLCCRVLDKELRPIPGLYAAGELAGMAGGHINGRHGLEGTMIGPSLFSGRVAGAGAAQEAGFGPGFRPAVPAQEAAKA